MNEKPFTLYHQSWVIAKCQHDTNLNLKLKLKLKVNPKPGSFGVSLWHKYVRLSLKGMMDFPKVLVSIIYVELPSVRTHHPVIHVESVGLTASSVAAIPVSVTPVTGVKGAGDGVLVALHHVVLGAPDVVPQVGVAVVVPVPGVVPGHLDEVGGGVAVAGHVGQVQGVGEVFVVERDLGVHVSNPAVLAPVGKVQPGVAPHGEPVVLDGDGPGSPVGCDDVDIPVVLDVDAAEAGGGDLAGRQEAESGHQEELHAAD